MSSSSTRPSSYNSGYSYADTRSFLSPTPTTMSTSSAASASVSSGSTSKSSLTSTIVGCVMCGLFLVLILACCWCKYCGARTFIRHLRRSDARSDAQIRRLTSDLADELITPYSSTRQAYDDRPCAECTRMMYMNIVQTVMGVGQGERREFRCAQHGQVDYMRQTSTAGPATGGARVPPHHTSMPADTLPLTGTPPTQEGEIDLQRNFQTRLHAVQTELAALAATLSRAPDSAGESQIDVQAVRGRQATLQVEAMWLNLSLASLEESRRTARPQDRAQVGRIRMEGLTLLQRGRVEEAMTRMGMGMGSWAGPGSGSGSGAFAFPGTPYGVTSASDEPYPNGVNDLGAPGPAGLAAARARWASERDPEAGVVEPPPAYQSVAGSEVDGGGLVIGLSGARGVAPSQVESRGNEGSRVGQAGGSVPMVQAGVTSATQPATREMGRAKRTEA